VFMKKILVLFFVSLIIACSSGEKTSLEKLSGIYPEMKCASVENYIKDNSIPFKGSDNAYTFYLNDNIWRKLKVKCDKNVTDIIITSRKGTDSKNSMGYTETKEVLSDAFRANNLVYIEGERIIDFNNGIYLQDIVDAEKGIILRYKVKAKKGKEPWEAALPLLAKIGKGD